MKSRTKTLLKLSTLLMLSGIIASAYADKLPVPSLPPIQGQIVVASDLVVRNIYAQSCKCDLSDVDALYMNKIKVRIGNNYPGNVATEGTLIVTYHDLRTGSPVTVTRPIPRLEIGRSIEIVAVHGPVLVRKSLGIKAEVQATTVSDQTPGNNVLIERTCYTNIID
jgi:hypothetical protein